MIGHRLYNINGIIYIYIRKIISWFVNKVLGIVKKKNWTKSVRTNVNILFIKFKFITNSYKVISIKNTLVIIYVHKVGFF